ncbi:hypothetical protein VTL71DRAFT_5769 [Oculimacula yallundae]|uniref:BTB domain-containing protein n=1 Tax=Oculimacula yallundae TaxID=86028 RepID=A0ABR4BZ49_9HELO
MENAQKNLLTTGRFSDLVLQCKGKDFPVHCSVVCMRSDVIANKVERWSHGQARTYNMDEQNVNVVEAFLEYLYLGKYGYKGKHTDDLEDPMDTPANQAIREALISEFKMRKISVGPSSRHACGTQLRNFVTEQDAYGRGSLLFQVRMYILADAYHVPDLKVYAANEFMASTKQSNAFDMGELAKAIDLTWDNIQSPNDTRMKETIGEVVFSNLKLTKHYHEIVERMPKEGDLGDYVIAAAKKHHHQTSAPTFFEEPPQLRRVYERLSAPRP